MDTEDLMSLVNDPSGRDLLLLSSRRAMTWDDILDSPLPAGMGARRAWYALQNLRSATAVTTPFAMGDVQRPWYSMTLELAEMVARIGRECHRESMLWKMFERASEQHFLMGMRVSDALASARLDGLEVSTEEVRSLLRHEQAPKSDAERLVKNAYAAADALPGLVDEPFSVELLRHLGEMVSAGVDVEGLPTRHRALGLMPFAMDDQNERESELLLEAVAGYANDELGDPHDPPVLRCLFLVDMMYGRHPMGKVSGQVGRLASSLYALKHDLPLLSVLPSLKARVEWGDGLVGPPAVACDRAALERTGEFVFAGDGGDSTLHQTIAAQLTCHLLDELKVKIDAWGRQDEAMREALRCDVPFNYRQRAILARALRQPNSTFTAKYHQTNHAISYATARRDLVELEEKGYLTMALDGNTMVFSPAEELGRRLGVTVIR